jgi:hypothetical protein
MKRILASLSAASTLCLSALPLIPHTYPQIPTPAQEHVQVMAATPPKPSAPLQASIQAEVVPTPTPTPIATPTPVERVLHQSRPTGTKTDWMAAAGIPQSDWQYVDFIVSKESSWNPNAVNPSSGACSLAQALPCSKIPGNWRDPVNALRWQHGYVRARYGSYAGAYAFWLKNSWY